MVLEEALFTEQNYFSFQITHIRRSAAWDRIFTRHAAQRLCHVVERFVRNRELIFNILLKNVTIILTDVCVCNWIYLRNFVAGHGLIYLSITVRCNKGLSFVRDCKTNNWCGLFLLLIFPCVKWNMMWRWILSNSDHPPTDLSDKVFIESLVANKIVPIW